MKSTIRRSAVFRGAGDNTDIEDGDGGGSNPSGGCGDNGGDSGK
ncbi:hypothetical protein [Streptomyces niveus]